MPYGLENDSTDDQLTAILHRLSQLETENSRLTQLVNSQAPSLPFFSSLRQPEPTCRPSGKIHRRTKGFSNIINQLELLFLLNPSCYSNDNIRLLQLGLMYWNCPPHGFNSVSGTPGAAPRTTTKLAQLQGTFFQTPFRAVDPAISAANDISLDYDRLAAQYQHT
ncbi:hypothetical protein BASA83_011674 [Batrachochytrium salamandrivorans]|nr:hypothetical protein BASA83_011674 [Batrachochytrium salamandrivorans]